MSTPCRYCKTPMTPMGLAVHQPKCATKSKAERANYAVHRVFRAHKPVPLKPCTYCRVPMKGSGLLEHEVCCKQRTPAERQFFREKHSWPDDHRRHRAQPRRLAGNA